MHHALRGSPTPVWTTPWACRAPPKPIPAPLFICGGQAQTHLRVCCRRPCSSCAGRRTLSAVCVSSLRTLAVDQHVFHRDECRAHVAAGPGRATPHHRLDEMIVISPNKQGKKSTAPPSPGPPHQTAGQMTWPSAATKAPGIRRTAGRGEVALAPPQIALRLDAALTPPPPANCRQPRRRQTPYYPRAHTHLRGCSRRCPSGTHLHAAAR